MKKPKISLDKDKLQQFFLLHIEKILLVIVVGLMLLLVYRGFSLPHLQSDLSPQALVSQSNGAKAYIDDAGRWNEVSAARTPPFDVVEQVSNTQKPSDPLAYMLVNTWSRPDFPKLSPREDPILFPPEKLIVRPVIGALASFPKSESEYRDPLFPEKSDEQIRAERKKKEADEKKKKKAEELATAPGGETKGKPNKKKKKGAEEGAEMGGAPRGRMAGPGMGDYGAQNPGGLFPEAVAVGFPVQNAEQTIARNIASVTVMAVVPIQKQTEEFEKKLANSLDYDPRRDVPYYMEYRIQRADVTEVDPATEADKLPWQNLPSPPRIYTEIAGDPNTGAVGLYAGFPIEVCDPSYLNFDVLTHPAPPYLQRDLWDLLTHPDVPLAAVNPAFAEGVPGTAAPAQAGGDDDVPSAPMMGAPGMPGMAGMPGGGEGGGFGGMRPGMNRMPGGEGGMPGGMPGMGGGMRPGGAMMPRPGGVGGMPGGGEGGMMGGGYGSGMPNYTPPKYQLIRFTDIHVEQGRKYRYRLRVYLHDPNHPMTGWTAPSLPSLHDTVRKRIKELDAADAARPKKQATDPAFRTSWVISPWSEPSPIAEVPHAERIYAGKVTPRAPTKVKNIDVPNEPAATALALVFDNNKIADIPGEMVVGRGFVVNFALDSKDKEKPAKVIHPVTKEIVDLEKYNVVTNAMVADIMGGESIKSIVTVSAGQALTNIGEMLVMDSDGKLHVQNEADDIVQFRRYTIPKEEKAKSKAKEKDAGLEGPRP